MQTLFSGKVPTYMLDTLGERVAKVNKRAVKRGFPTVSLIKGDTSIVLDPYFTHECGAYDKQATCDERATEVEYTDIEVRAAGPLKMSGWRLLGVITPVDSDAGFLTTDVPGESTRDVVISEWNTCQHCNSRRYRTETFIVRHDDGRTMQVGRNCIRDFLGMDPAALISGLDAFRSLSFSDDEREQWGSAAPRLYGTADIITAAAQVVAHDGWYVSKAKAEESEGWDKPIDSTASRTMRLLTPPRTKWDREFHAEYSGNEAAVEALKDATFAALRNLYAKPGVSEYEHKVMAATEARRVPAKFVGIIASATILGLRQQEQDGARAVYVKQVETQTTTGKHIGAVGERLKNVALTVTFVRHFDNDFGGTTLIKGVTADGDLVQWFRSGYWVDEVEVGQAMTWTGTVKAHDMDKFTKQPVTVLTRCKVV